MTQPNTKSESRAYSPKSNRQASLPMTRRAQGLMLLGQMLGQGAGRWLHAGSFHSLHSLSMLTLILAALLCSRATHAADIQIHVEDIHDVRGTLFWAVYDSGENYDSEQLPVISGRSRIAAKSLTVTLHNQPDGDYAVKLFHDANNNGQMDSNLLGLPQEGYGFSNDAGSFGPASFEDAKVRVVGDTQIIIKLR